MKKLLLLSDENALTRELIALTARGADYDVIYADDGELMTDRAPDIAIFSSGRSPQIKICRELFPQCEIYRLKEDGKGKSVISLPIDLSRLVEIFGFDDMPSDLALSSDDPSVTAGGKRVELTLNELELFKCFAANPNRVFSREQLALEVFGADIADIQTLTDDTVLSLISKLEGLSDRWTLKHIWGVGYKFEVRNFI